MRAVLGIILLVFLWWVIEKGPVEVATQLNQAYHVLVR